MERKTYTVPFEIKNDRVDDFIKWARNTFSFPVRKRTNNDKVTVVTFDLTGTDEEVNSITNYINKIVYVKNKHRKTKKIKDEGAVIKFLNIFCNNLNKEVTVNIDKCSFLSSESECDLVVHMDLLKLIFHVNAE